MSNPLIAQPQLAAGGGVPDIETDPKKVAAQAAMMKLLAAQSESIISMFDRLGVEWERRNIKDESYIVIKWSELMKGERALQDSPTFLQRIAEKANKELKGLQ